MKIGGVEFTLRLTYLPHYLNGELTPWFVDCDAREILISHTGDAMTLATLTAAAVTVAIAEYRNFSPAKPRKRKTKRP